VSRNSTRTRDPIQQADKLSGVDSRAAEHEVVQQAEARHDVGARLVRQQPFGVTDPDEPLLQAVDDVAEPRPKRVALDAARVVTRPGPSR